MNKIKRRMLRRKARKMPKSDIMDQISHTSDMERDWTNDERTKITRELKQLKPWGWRVLVMPVRPRAVSKGGIIIPYSRQETDSYLTYVGRLIAYGPAAKHHPKYAEMGMDAKNPKHWPEPGDWVIYPLNSYQRLTYKHFKLVVLNDDSMLLPVPEGMNPWHFKLDR